MKKDRAPEDKIPMLDAIQFVTGKQQRKSKNSTILNDTN